MVLCKLLILVLSYPLVHNQKFVVHLLNEKNQVTFDEANKFCQKKYKNGRLAVFNDPVSKESLQRKLYDYGKPSKFKQIKF